jgi:type IV pili sensor histidine kinase/response regulator
VSAPSDAAAVAHYSRYTLIEMSPEVAQIDLLQQVVDVRIPALASTSVGDTLRYVLLHTGYRLCEDATIRDLDSFPLPAAHMHLGPLPLASALQLLVGHGWQLETDEASRHICFSRLDARSLGSPAPASGRGRELPQEAGTPSTGGRP